jgi:uncharacterized membrane protein YGL010W
MNEFFRRQLAEYADYHRDERNRLTHIFGIPVIFLAIVLPLSLWPVPVFGTPANAAILLVIPVLIVWIGLDVAIGLAMLAAIIPLLFIAAMIASQVSSSGVWLIAAVLFVIGWTLQIIGHTRFEHRKPALLDNPMHLLIGPMFMIAKLFVALGMRPDLARAIQAGTDDGAKRL